MTKAAVEVTYEDGSVESHSLGTRHATAAGVTYPHQVVANVKEGDTVAQGDNLTYNPAFFTHDPFNPGQVALKAGVMVKTAIMDTISELEDGSSISARTAERLKTQTTEIKTVQVRFDQTVKDLVKTGDHVDLDSILCTIEDPETAENPLFDEVSRDTLKRLSSATPRAKVTGTVSRVEVYYHGDYEDLSPNLQELVTWADKKRKREAKAQGKKAFSGAVDTNFRVGGEALDLDTVAIQIYMDHQVPAGRGDKGVFGNQMKSVFSKVMTGTNQTELGEDLDAVFGNTSIEDRMVNSPRLMGTTNTLLRALSKHVAGVYRGERDERRKT